QIPRPILGPEVRAFGARHRDGIHGGLRSPFKQRVPLRQRDNLFIAQGLGPSETGLHRLGRCGRFQRDGRVPIFLGPLWLARAHDRGLRLINEPAPARPTNTPFSMTSAPRERTVSGTPVTSRPSYGL